MVGRVGLIARVCALAALSVGLSGALSAKELLYVGAQRSDDIHIIDATTFEPVGNIHIGFEIDDLVGSRDGKIVYGNAIIPNGNPYGFAEAGVAYAISTATNKILWWSAIDALPQHMTVSQDGKRLFLPVYDRSRIYVLDTATGRIIDRWFSTLGNHGSELSADGQRLYIGNIAGKVIMAYDVSTGQMVKSFKARDGVRPFKMDRAEKNIYYQLSNFHGFEVRDLESGKVTKVVDLPKLPPGTEPDRNETLNHGMAITPDGKKLVTAGSAGGYVAVHSLPDLKLLGTVKVGADPNWIRIRADSRVAFISNRVTNTISVVDIDALKELKQVPAGTRPARFDIVDVK